MFDVFFLGHFFHSTSGCWINDFSRDFRSQNFYYGPFLANISDTSFLSIPKCTGTYIGFTMLTGHIGSEENYIPISIRSLRSCLGCLKQLQCSYPTATGKEILCHYKPYTVLWYIKSRYQKVLTFWYTFKNYNTSSCKFSLSSNIFYKLFLILI